ncbi:hypothetical protein ACFT38_41060 [Streptomyces sp. NPDC056975]|uniref:hypothetical protein n=1 Tax=Streptomyces sp. NPDC056975 TaxID=3345985 RepID=UPI003635F60B
MQAVVLDVVGAVAEAYNTGHRAAVAELGELSDERPRTVDSGPGPLTGFRRWYGL